MKPWPTWMAYPGSLGSSSEQIAAVGPSSISELASSVKFQVSCRSHCRHPGSSLPWQRSFGGDARQKRSRRRSSRFGGHVRGFRPDRIGAGNVVGGGVVEFQKSQKSPALGFQSFSVHDRGCRDALIELFNGLAKKRALLAGARLAFIQACRQRIALPGHGARPLDDLKDHVALNRVDRMGIGLFGGFLSLIESIPLDGGATGHGAIGALGRARSR